MHTTLGKSDRQVAVLHRWLKATVKRMTSSAADIGERVSRLELYTLIEQKAEDKAEAIILTSMVETMMDFDVTEGIELAQAY